MTSNALLPALLCATLVLGLAVVVSVAPAMRSRPQVRRRLTGGAEPSGLSLTHLPSLRPPPALARRLEAAAVPSDPAVAWAGWLLGVPLVSVTALVLSGPGLAALALLTLVVAPALVLQAGGGRRDRRLEAALPEALEGVARSLQSGASLRQALAEVAVATPGALGEDLAGVADEAAHGTPLVAALEGWERRRPLTGIRLAVAVLALGAETGGAHARAIDGVAETVRSRLAVAAEVRALSSQARFSGLVIALAPIGFAAVATATDQRTADFLFRQPLGLACLAVGLGLDGLAGLWMHRLAKVEP